MAVLNVPGCRLAYDVAGAGRPIVFLHGVGSDRHAWDGQLRRFGRTHRAVAVDLRGHGESAAAAESITIEAFADDVAALVDALGAGPAHLCGLSMGGIVALETFRRRSEVVRSLILADAWAHHPEAAAGLTARLAAIDAGSMAELARARMPAALGPGADPELLEAAVAVMAVKDKACYRRSNEVLWATDLRELARSVWVPALVLVGDQDGITPPELSEELAQLIPGARLSLIPGAGHLSNLENPVRFDATVAAFLAMVDR